MTNDAALKLTTARYFTPSGRSIQAHGITPDILIDHVKIEEVEKDDNAIKEANLSGHLDNPNDKPQGTLLDSGEKPETEEQATGSLATSDYALYEALNVLKGLAIVQNTAG